MSMDISDYGIRLTDKLSDIRDKALLVDDCIAFFWKPEERLVLAVSLGRRNCIAWIDKYYQAVYSSMSYAVTLRATKALKRNRKKLEELGRREFNAGQ